MRHVGAIMLTNVMRFLINYTARRIKRKQNTAHAKEQGPSTKYSNKWFVLLLIIRQPVHYCARNKYTEIAQIVPYGQIDRSGID